TYDPKFLEYSFEGNDALVVFSEIYYEGSGNDWQAYIDGEAVDHLRVNYLLRGLQVPAGKHTITFEFAPKSYYLGRKINFAGSGILLLLLGWMGWKQRKEA
ncbi:MAG: YfhO family protein, partial [Schleiferiaceae bacterium]